MNKINGFKGRYCMVFLILFICIFVLSACNSCSMNFNNFMSPKTSVSIVSYNTQTFFDAIDNGSEFKQFRGSKTKWCKDRYAERLDRLKNAVQLASFKLGFDEDSLPDILVLQEVESIAVIEDFSKILPLHNSYKEAVFFSPEKGSPFSTAILSKFPIIKAKKYTLHCEKANLRPVIETRIKIDIEPEAIELVLFSVHWKSKAGSIESDSIRAMQEKQLYRIITDLKNSESETPFVICGDFNQKPEEFLLLNQLNNCWDFPEYKDSLNFLAQPKGSYFYKNEWEAIDHFFYSENLADGYNLDISKFAVINEIPLVNDDGIPKKYLVYSGSGYSDHLPIGIVLTNLQD